MMNTLKAMFLMQAFYAMLVSGIVHALPDSVVEEHSMSWAFTSFETNMSIDENMTSDIQNTLESERSAPFVNLGTLVFYSGNIVIDLLVNFVTAIPGMASLFIGGLFMIIGLDAQLSAQITLMIVGVLTFFYVAQILSMLLSVRTGRSIE